MKLKSLYFCTILSLVLFKVELLTYIDANSDFDFDDIDIIDSRSQASTIDHENVSIVDSATPNEIINEPPRFKPPEVTKPRLLVVDIQNQIGNQFLQYQRDEINLGDTYTAVAPNVIFKIIDQNQVLWKAKNTNYPYKVFVGDEINDQRHIQVYFPPMSSEDQDFTPPAQTDFQFTLLEIDIKVKNTDQYVIYKKDPRNDREKFTCKPGYLIYKVYSGLKLVTKAADHRYFDRVVIYKDEFENRNLQGLVPGQIDEGDPEEPLPVFTPPDADFALLQSEVLDHQNHLVYVNVKNKLSTKFVTYEVDVANNVDIFTAKEPYRFALVMNGKHRAWKYKNGEHPNQVFLFNDDKGSPLLRLGFPRVVSRFPKPTLITLDVRNIESNHEFSYEYDAPAQTQIFRPKPGFLIDKVMKGSILMWKCENFIYPEKVMIFPDENGEKALRLDFPSQPEKERPPPTPESRSEPESKSEPDSETEPESEPKPEPESEAGSKSDSEKVDEPEPKPESESESESEKVDEPEPESEPLHEPEPHVQSKPIKAPIKHTGVGEGSKPITTVEPQPKVVPLPRRIPIKQSRPRERWVQKHTIDPQPKVVPLPRKSPVKQPSVRDRIDPIPLTKLEPIVPPFKKYSVRDRDIPILQSKRQPHFEPRPVVSPPKHASHRESITHLQEIKLEPQYEQVPLFPPVKHTKPRESVAQILETDPEEHLEPEHKLEPKHQSDPNLQLDPQDIIDAFKETSPREKIRLPDIELDPVMESVNLPSPKGSLRLPGSETETSEHTRYIRSKRPVRLPHSEPELVFKSDKTFEPEPRIKVSIPKPEPKSVPKPETKPQPKPEPKFKPDQFTITGTRRGPKKVIAEEKEPVVPKKYKSGNYIYKKDPTGLILDFTRKTDVFKYDTYVANHTYTATVAHLFNKVGIYDPHVKDILYIWEAPSSDKYAYKVEQFGYHHVLIYMINGTFELFHRDDNDNWTHQKYSQEEEDDIEVRKPEHEVVTFDEDGTVDSTSLFNKLIHVDIAHKWNTFMSGYTKEGNLYIFKPGEGFIIAAVMDSSVNTYLGQAVPIWETGDPTKFCECVEHDVTEDILTLHCMDGSRKIFKKVNKKWINFMFDHSVDNSKKIPIILNLSSQSRFATYEFESDDNNKSMTCTAKKGYAIKEVVWLQSEYQWFRNDKYVWSTEDPLYFALKVHVKDLGFGEKIVNIDLFNGLRLTYHRSLWGVKWDYMGSKVIREK